MADDAEWSAAASTPAPDPRVYLWPGSAFDRPARLLGRATAIYPSPVPGRLWLSTAQHRAGVTTFTVRELDTQGRQTSPPRSLGPHRWVQGFVVGGRVLTTELLPVGARRGPGWLELLDVRTGRVVRRLGLVGATMATAHGRLVGHHTGCARRAARNLDAAGGPAWPVGCATLSVVNVDTGQRWRSVDGRGWTIPMPISPDGRWFSYLRRSRPSGPIDLLVTGPDGRPVRLLGATRFSQEWPNNRVTTWTSTVDIVLAVYQERTGAPWRFAGWQIGPAGPARLPLHLDDLLADTGRPAHTCRPSSRSRSPEHLLVCFLPPAKRINGWVSAAVSRAARHAFGPTSHGAQAAVRPSRGQRQGRVLMSTGGWVRRPPCTCGRCPLARHRRSDGSAGPGHAQKPRVTRPRFAT